MARTDTLEYFLNVANGIQTAEAKDIAREALDLIYEMLEEQVAYSAESMQRTAEMRKLLTG